MKKHYYILSLILIIGLSFSTVYGQKENKEGGDRLISPPIPSSTPPSLADLFAENLKKFPTEVELPREQREKAFASLLAGQRHMWRLRKTRSRLAIQTEARLAKESLSNAIKLNPRLAEAYTALAELSLTVPPQDVEEAIKLSQMAVDLNNDNFGGHRFLSRLYTIKSNLGRSRLNKEFTQKAIDEWKEILRLDPRHAEAWAFLSSFYKETNQTEKRIEALRNWMSSSTPLETGFYNRVMIQDGGLTLENASLQLGEALIDSGNNKEALSILTRAVSDSPESLQAVELLSQALDNAEGESILPAIDALRQAVYSNPDNVSLNQLLAQTIAKSGNVEDAVKFLKEAVVKYSVTDKITASSFQVSLGDIYAEANRIDEAIQSYQTALEIRGIEKNELTSDEERDFAFLVVNKMIKSYKKANRFEEARSIIETYRPLFGKDDSSLDREVIGLLRDAGKKNDALELVRRKRLAVPESYNLIRTEASILTDLGKVDEGINLINGLIENKPSGVAPSIMYDDFINYLYITSLYIQSGRGNDAILSVNKAIKIAKGDENKQIGLVALASAHQLLGEYGKSEKILEEVLAESPNNPDALNNLGYLFLVSGKNYQKAFEYITEAIKVDPKNPSYLDSLGWAYFKLGKLDLAEKYLTKAASYDSSSATILEHLGDVFEKKGKKVQAKDVWKKALNYTINSNTSKRIENKLTR